MVNKKAQGAIVDLLILIIIVSLMVLFLGNQATGRAVESGRSRAQSAYVQRLLITTLNYWDSEINGTIAEGIGMSYCGEDSKVIEIINSTIERTNKPGHYYILTICPDGNCTHGICSEYISEKYGCRIRTEHINIAFFNMTLPTTCDKDFIEIYLGIWPETMRIEAYE